MLYEVPPTVRDKLVAEESDFEVGSSTFEAHLAERWTSVSQPRLR